MLPKTIAAEGHWAIYHEASGQWSAEFAVAYNHLDDHQLQQLTNKLMGHHLILTDKQQGVDGTWSARAFNTVSNVSKTELIKSEQAMLATMQDLMKLN